MVYVKLLSGEGTRIIPVHLDTGKTEIKRNLALKKDKTVFSNEWKILRIARGKPSSNYCRLSIRENLFITNSIGDNRVLKRNLNLLINAYTKISI